MTFAFISHAVPDKRTHVGPLVQALAIEGVSLRLDRPGSGSDDYLDQLRRGADQINAAPHCRSGTTSTTGTDLTTASTSSHQSRASWFPE